MVDQIGIRELRDNLTAVIRRVRAGETVEITHHHRTVAVIKPAAPDRISRLIGSGDLIPGTPLDRPIRTFPVTTGITGSQAIEEDRAGR